MAKYTREDIVKLVKKKTSSISVFNLLTFLERSRMLKFL